MSEVSSEFVQEIVQNNDERIELYRSQYFVVSKIRLFNKWRIEKRLTTEYEFQPIQRESLEREFEVGYQLDHPNIVRYLELRKTEQGVPFIIMEYVDGMNLQEYMQSDLSCTRKDFDNIFMSLLSALNYLQQRQIYHLDIKPENIVVTFKEHIPKLIDFGFSNTDTYNTSLGSTAKYSTEEHCNYSKVSSKTDMFSFAKTMLVFAETKKITVGRKEKNVLNLCIQNDSQKRLDANSALQIIQGQSKKNFVFWLIGFILLLLIFFLKYKNVEKENSIEIQEDSVVRFETQQKYIEESDSVVTLQSEENAPQKESVVQSKTEKIFVSSQSDQHSKNEDIFVNPYSELKTQEDVDKMVTAATTVMSGAFSQDSLFLVNVAMQKVEDYREIIGSDTDIDKSILRRKLCDEYLKTSDSVIRFYMNANRFGMVSNLSFFRFLLLDKIEYKMDSLAKTK